MPRDRCHKIVEAARITAIDGQNPPAFAGVVCRGSFVLGSACGHCERCPWERSATNAIILRFGPDAAPAVTRAFMARHQPEVGGYFVRYEDGYESFSPAAAFESGYTRLDP